VASEIGFGFAVGYFGRTLGPDNREGHTRGSRHVPFRRPRLDVLVDDDDTAVAGNESGHPSERLVQNVPPTPNPTTNNGLPPHAIPFQDKVRDELVGIFGDSDRNATIDDLKAMRYLEAVIKESLRIYPSLLSYTREISTTLTLSECSILHAQLFERLSYPIFPNQLPYRNRLRAKIRTLWLPSDVFMGGGGDTRGFHHPKECLKIPNFKPIKL